MSGKQSDFCHVCLRGLYRSGPCDSKCQWPGTEYVSLFAFPMSLARKCPVALSTWKTDEGFFVGGVLF